MWFAIFPLANILVSLGNTHSPMSVDTISFDTFGENENRITDEPVEGEEKKETCLALSPESEMHKTTMLLQVGLGD